VLFLLARKGKLSIMPQQTQTVFLKNEQPVAGCKDCQILWFQLIDFRNKWRARPSEYRWQELFEGAQGAYLNHWDTHQEAGVQAHAR
jgi:hypothetical protein